MEYFRIKGWEEHQTYRKDRGTPPWIKVHRSLLTNQKWSQLTDCEKGQLVSLWIVAADRNGTIPANLAMLKKVAQLDKEPNLLKFIDLGLIEGDVNRLGVNLASTWRQDDVPEERREEKRRAEESVRTKKASQTPSELTAQFLGSLKSNPAYSHIDLDRELGKMDAWLQAHAGRKKTKRFVLNWINKIEPALTTGPAVNSWAHLPDLDAEMDEQRKRREQEKSKKEAAHA